MSDRGSEENDAAINSFEASAEQPNPVRVSLQRRHMHSDCSRRHFLALTGAFLSSRSLRAKNAERSLRTPYKYSKLVLTPSGREGEFDSKSVDCPFVFYNDGSWWMTFVAFDGIGYQTGLAKSSNLVDWQTLGCILKRDPNSPIRRYNVAMNWILRDSDLSSPGQVIRLGDKYVGAYHSYPNPGYERGPAVIGLAYSPDLIHWEAGDPILGSEDGSPWEHGGLYKPCLIQSGGTYFLFYNAKDRDSAGWHEQIGVATSKNLKSWTRFAGNPILRNGGPGAFDEYFASDPCVLRDGAVWAFFYYGLDGKQVARDLVAVGPDLFHPAKDPSPLIEPGPPGSYDSKYAHKPSIITANGDLYHFYCAVGGDPLIRGIAVARSRPW